MFRFFWRTSPVIKKLYFESASPMLSLAELHLLHACTRSLWWMFACGRCVSERKFGRGELLGSASPMLDYTHGAAMHFTTKRAQIFF